jgi:hypothetical protein
MELESWTPLLSARIFIASWCGCATISKSTEYVRVGLAARVVAYAIHKDRAQKLEIGSNWVVARRTKVSLKTIVQRICTPCPSKVSKTWVACGVLVSRLGTSLTPASGSQRPAIDAQPMKVLAKAMFAHVHCFVSS